MEVNNNLNGLKFILAFYSNCAFYHNYDLETNSLGPAQNISNENLSVLKKYVKTKNPKTFEIKGLFPNNLLYYNPTKRKIIWHTEEQERWLYFDKDNEMLSGNYKLPKLVWFLDKESLYVFSHYSKKILPETKLYYAPFFNLSSNGNVCMGNVKWTTEKETFKILFEHIYAVFFTSNFTSDGWDYVFTVPREEAYIKAKKENIDFDEFAKPTNYTLESLIK